MTADIVEPRGQQLFPYSLIRNFIGSVALDHPGNISPGRQLSPPVNRLLACCS